jgi:cytochrome b
VSAAGSVRAWDWPTRAFHWALVFGVVSAFASFRFADRIGDPMLVWHRWNGFALLVLVVFRLLWGVAGSSTARFRTFVTWPWTVLSYLRDLASGRGRRFLGHNPLGGWMVLTLLLGVAVQGGLGLFSLEHNELVAGPLKRLVSHETSEAITKLHVQGFNVILGLVAIHVSANVLYGLVKKEPLITAMITGNKPRESYEDQNEAEFPTRVGARAAACLCLAAIIVFGGITLLGGRIL